MLREHITVRLAPEVMERVNQRCRVLNCSQAYVIEDALAEMFGMKQSGFIPGKRTRRTQDERD